MSVLNNRFMRVAVIATGLMIISSCSAPFSSEKVCTLELRSVLQVDVIDSVTRAPAAGGATVSVRGGAFVDSQMLPDTSTSLVAYIWFEDRVKAGTYTVQVHKAGYRDWTRANIRIEANECHVSTFEHLTALLQR